MKLKLLFVQDSLNLAGSEKSLMALLKNIDPSKFEIDLQLNSYGGALEKELPSHVHLLQPLPIKTKLKSSLLHHLFSIRNYTDFEIFIKRTLYSLKIRNNKLSHSEKAQLYWETIGCVISIFNKEYDVAIGFAQGFPTFYVADKVIAKKKFCWINANMIFKGNHRFFQEKYYKHFDCVVCISRQNLEHMQTQLPGINNFQIIENIIDFKEISLLANEPLHHPFNNEITNILTVGRLEKYSKGMDIALYALKSLKEKTLNFHWYFLGDGPYKTIMKSFIKEHGLEDFVTFLGSKPNPYPYFKEADIYVQTSRHEGFGRTIAEARMLNVPLVTTKFDTVHQQITNEVNGLIADMNGEAVATGIYRLIQDENLYSKIKNNLKLETKENLETIKKFDKLVLS